MRLSMRQRVVVALIFVSIAAILLVHVIPSMALILYLIAAFVVVIAVALEFAEYSLKREKGNRP